MVLVVHRGKGAVVILLPIIAALAMNTVTRAMFDGRYYAEHAWPKFGTLWLAGLFCIALGVYLRKNPTRKGDKDWLPSESADHLFFIPVFYWGVIFFVVGAIYALSAFRE